MIRTTANTRGGKPSVGFSHMVFLLLLLGSFLYFYQPPEMGPPPLAAASSPPAIEYEVTTSDITVDWTGGGDFDPRDKCPEDFFAAGFTVICRKMKQRGYFKFLYHKKKKLLYRIDKDVFNGKAKIGLHWVESTRFSSKYRIADASYKGGKAVPVPNGKGGKDLKVFRYGEVVSPKRVQSHRELFRETHIQPKQCEGWWDIFDFIP